MDLNCHTTAHIIYQKTNKQTPCILRAMKRKREYNNKKNLSLSSSLVKRKSNEKCSPSFKLPIESWMEIVSHIPKHDIKTLMSFMVTSKENFEIIFKRIQELFVDFLISSYEIKHIYNPRNNKIRIISEKNDTGNLFECIESWVYRNRVYPTDIPSCQEVFTYIYRYILYCVLDSDHQTIEHYSNVLSFMRLCHLDNKYLYTRTKSKDGSINLCYFDINAFRSTSRLKNMLYFNKETNKSERLYNMNKIRVVKGMDYATSII